MAAPTPADARRANSGGVVPLALTLAPCDIAAATPPPTLYINAPALSYLPAAALPRALAAFRLVLPPGPDTPWFEADGGGGAPLRWHLPIGVLADAAGVGAEGGGGGPWRLMLHLRSPPPRDAPGLLPWHGPAPDRDAYLNSLKEAAAAVAGSAARIVSLAPGDIDALWTSATAGDASATAAAVAAAGVAPAARGERGPAAPLRVVLARGGGGRGGVVAALSAPAPLTTDGRPTTLGEAVAGLLGTSGLAGGDDGGWEVRAGALVRAGGGPAATATVFGVAAPLDAPLEWAHACLGACDTFLYVVVREGGGEGEGG